MSTPKAILGAILAFANERDWARRKQIVERDHDLLLDEKADGMLATAISKNAKHPSKRKLLEESRRVLADCRAMGIDAAFVGLLDPTPGLKSAIEELLAADSIAGTYQTTVQHQQLLLTDEADWLLTAMAHQTPDRAERIAQLRELLARCRRQGLEPAFEQVLGKDRTVAAFEALEQAISSPQATEQVLGEYQDVLLSDDALQQFEERASASDDSLEGRRVVDAMRSALSIARTDGIKTASVACQLPPFEQLICRCFSALASNAPPEPDRRFGINEILEAHIGEIDSDFAARMRAWSQTEPKAETRVSLLDTSARALSGLGSALRDLRLGTPELNEQAASACFQTANQCTQTIFSVNQKRVRREHVFGSAEEAVAAATRMQLGEGYDLFRGQTRAWPVVSSYRRLDGQERSDAKARANQFINWATDEPALAQYGFSSDEIIAVGQHYGIATTFLGFTTDIEVARYFATEPDDELGEADSEMSCIVAIRSAHLEAWVADRFQQSGTFMGPPLLRLDLQNLWRLRSQCGVFVVDADFLDDYPFVYLMFPAGPATDPAPDRTRVYPEERSDLEAILDRWFGCQRLDQLRRDGLTNRSL